MQLTLLTTIALCVSWAGGGAAQEYYFGDGDFPSDGGEDIQVSYRALGDDEPLHDVGYSFLEQFKDKIKGTINNLFVERQEVDAEGHEGFFTLSPLDILDVDVTFNNITNTLSGFTYFYKVPLITVEYYYEFFMDGFGDVTGVYSVVLQNANILYKFKKGRKDGKFEFTEDTIELKVDESDIGLSYTIDKIEDLIKQEGKFTKFGRVLINNYVKVTLGREIIAMIQASIIDLKKSRRKK